MCILSDYCETLSNNACMSGNKYPRVLTEYWAAVQRLDAGDNCSNKFSSVLDWATFPGLVTRDNG